MLVMVLSLAMNKKAEEILTLIVAPGVLAGHDNRVSCLGITEDGMAVCDQLLLFQTFNFHTFMLPCRCVLGRGTHS